MGDRWGGATYTEQFSLLLGTKPQQNGFHSLRELNFWFMGQYAQRVGRANKLRCLPPLIRHQSCQGRLGCFNQEGKVCLLWLLREGWALTLLSCCYWATWFCFYSFECFLCCFFLIENPWAANFLCVNPLPLGSNLPFLPMALLCRMSGSTFSQLSSSPRCLH